MSGNFATTVSLVRDFLKLNRFLSPLLQITDLRHTSNGSQDNEGLELEYTWERPLKHVNQIVN